MTVALSIFGTLLAVVVGAVLGARFERRHWLRQQRLEAWSTLLALADQAVKLTEPSEDEPDSPEEKIAYLEAKRARNQARMDLGTSAALAVFRAQLLGPRQLERALHDYGHALIRMLDKGEGDQFGERLAVFVAAAQRALGAGR
jgi:hypothetical protein